MLAGLKWLAILPGLLALEVRADMLRDLDLRVAYGFYSADIAVLRAAVAELEAIRSPGPDARLLQALARYRIAETSGSPDEAASALASCIAAADSVDGGGAAEAAVLTAACSLKLAETEPLKALLHERRMQRALDTASALAPQNPRAALVASLVEARAHGRGAQFVASVERAVALFEAAPAGTGLVWGEAESYLLLATARREAGDVRRARDAVEAALLAAPGYRAALELQAELAGRRR